jgi:uncharacterized protein (DUF58 family)
MWGQGSWRATIRRILNRNLPEQSRIELRIGWPLLLLPVVLFNQVVAPHATWVVLSVTLAGLYGLGYLWVRSMAPALEVVRTRMSAILVAGDLLREEFELHNVSRLPVLWAEVVDQSDLPDYEAGRVVACGALSFYRWRVEVECKQRGVFRLGPHTLHLQDPLGLFDLSIEFPHQDVVLIYPRVVELPRLPLPHGNTQGTDRRRRPLRGVQPAATVSEYRPGDSLRHVHWRTSAHRGRLMVKELETEPSGDIWIVLDLWNAAHSGRGETSTLETGVMLAASLAAELLAARDRRAVGLLAAGSAAEGAETQPWLIPPLPGQAQLWQIMAALARIQAGEVSLADLLASNGEALGRWGSLIVVTPHTGETGGLDWPAALLHLKGVGLESSVVLVAPQAEDDTQAGDRVRAGLATTREVLARVDIPSTTVEAGSPLQPVLRFRRRRTVVRSTPTGGAVTYEEEEVVG